MMYPLVKSQYTSYDVPAGEVNILLQLQHTSFDVPAGDTADTPAIKYLLVKSQNQL